MYFHTSWATPRLQTLKTIQRSLEGSPFGSPSFIMKNVTVDSDPLSLSALSSQLSAFSFELLASAVRRSSRLFVSALSLPLSLPVRSSEPHSRMTLDLEIMS